MIILQLLCQNQPAVSPINITFAIQLRIMSTAHLSEQEQIRRAKLEDIKALNIDPYPAALYPVNMHSADIKSNYTEELKESYADVCLAGRLMSVRDMGKASFGVLQDDRGKIQFYLKQDDICP